jgi:hypothetical protein
MIESAINLTMGSFRRRIVVTHRSTDEGGEARAVLEDDFHHFRVMVRHDGTQVTTVTAEALRSPYSACPAAARELQRLAGMVLEPIASAVSRATPATEHCTHLLDLAGLAVAAAALRRPQCQYDIEVPDRLEGRTQARLARDGQPWLAWDLLETSIASPARYAGVSLRDGLARWALSALPPDEAEAAIVLRRCALISLGRQKALDAQVHAVPTGLCYAQQPDRATQALRIVGSTWDFSHRADTLCGGDLHWLHGGSSSGGTRA